MTIPYLGPMGGVTLPKWLVNPETDDELAQRYPGTFGDPIPGPLNPVWPQNALPSVPALSPGELGMLQSQTPSQETMTAPVTPGWAANLFGGADPLAQGMFRPRDARALGRQALLNASLNILANSGPAPYRRGLGEILAGGIQAGQQSYQQGAQQALAQRGALQQQNILAQRQRLAQQYAGKSDIPSLTAYLHDLIGIGDYEGARSLSEYLKSQRENPTRGQVIQEVGPNGQVRQRVIDPTQIGQTFGAPDVPKQENFGPVRNRIVRELYDPYTVKAINAYHQFNSHFSEAQAGNPAAYKATVSAFITNAEPSNQLRLGMLQYLQEIDPSIQGRADIALQRLKEGKWPDAALQGMQRIVEDNFRQLRDRTQSLYDYYAEAEPEAIRSVPPPSVRFGDAYRQQPVKRSTPSRPVP